MRLLQNPSETPREGTRPTGIQAIAGPCSFAKASTTEEIDRFVEVIREIQKFFGK